MFKKLLCLICAVGLVTAVGTTVYADSKSNEPTSGPAAEEADAVTSLISNEDDYALSLLGCSIGYAVINETEHPDRTTLGDWMQVGFVDAQTLTSFTAAQVIAADEDTRLNIVPVVYQITCSADQENHLFWDVSAMAFSDALDLQSLSAVMTYPDTRADSFCTDYSESSQEVKTDACSTHTFPSGSEIPVSWELRTGLGDAGAFEHQICGSSCVTIP